MVWESFWGKQRGTFVLLVVHSVNTSVYCRLFESLLLLVINHTNRTIGNGKNKTVHTAKLVTEFLKRENISAIANISGFTSSGTYMQGILTLETPLMQSELGLLKSRLKPGIQFQSLFLNRCGGVCLTGLLVHSLLVYRQPFLLVQLFFNFAETLDSTSLLPILH